ncbi:Uncharacterized protein QJS10_CPB20g01401 [Acorus calamus]|uniref:Uncharacterized protein n=1 Tax=Acorus calamus TaxID=4465 RepID=A0AAV9CAE9_ACOCL|nr:Uncharacterized protein QJS10_CPB20g01401 [Acorus calamus]
MATSIGSQLKALKLFAIEEPQKRPHIEPSVIFDAKEAADIDRKSILLIAISGLDALANVESRFGIYRSTLFRQGSLNEDRLYLREEENRKLDGLIASYLRLLSGYLQLPAALKTLEYLIRQYKVHLHPTNVDELVLCALPYHDTQVFVRIVQLIDFGRNKKWGFLEGVKTSGAPCPRKVIVQQCIRDKGVLNAICNYASQSKDFQEPKPVVCFCTAVVVEALGSVPALDSDTVLSIRPFVSRWLNPKSSMDYKAGALMIVGLMAKNMQPDLIDSADLPWLRLTMMAIIGLVQSQSIESFPIKSLNILKNISPSDDSSCLALIKIIEKVCIKAFVDKIVSKVLGRIVSKLRRKESSELNVRGTLSEDWAKPVLVAIDKNYPSELRVANSKPFSKEEDFILDRLCVVLDGSLDTAIEISDPKVWLSMQHPKAEVRRAALAGLATHGVLNSVAISSLKNTNFQEAILLRGLNDEDLSVIHDVLSLKNLCETSLKLNVSALELLKDIEWPVYLGVSHSHDLSSILETKRPNLRQADHIQFSKECWVTLKSQDNSLLLLFEAFFPFLKHEWIEVESRENAVLAEEDLRVAAVKCIEGLYKVWQCVDSPSVRNGNDTSLARCMLTQEFGEFLRLIVHQKELISSDPNVLPSLLTSLLGQPGNGLLVPHMDKRFGQDTKDIILIFILNAVLKFSSYAKLQHDQVTGHCSLLFSHEYEYGTLKIRVNEKQSFVCIMSGLKPSDAVEQECGETMGDQVDDQNVGNSVPSYREEEEVMKKKYGGLLPKKPPLISKDHERAFFDSADWALGKQGAPVEKPKNLIEALRPKLQPTPHQQVRSRRSAYAPADSEDGMSAAHEDPSNE